MVPVAAWQAALEQADAKISSFDADGLVLAIHDLQASFARLLDDDELTADELRRARAHLELFVSRCGYLKQQLNAALSAAAEPKQSVTPYAKFGRSMQSSTPLMRRTL